MSSTAPRKYDHIAVSDESTVVAEDIPEATGDGSYQTESELEHELIRLLKSQKYEYLPITSEEQIVGNLRTQLETLNSVTFSEAEWKQFFSERITGANNGIVEKTVRIQEDHIQLLKRDDGSEKNINLIDKQNIHNNRLQVINQYETGQGDGSFPAPTATMSRFWSTACRWCTSSSNGVVSTSVKHSTRSTTTSVKASGQTQDSSSMCIYS